MQAMSSKMYQWTVLLVVVLVSTCSDAKFKPFEKLQVLANMYTAKDLFPNSTSNELWQGFIEHCPRDKSDTSVSCIQKVVYGYLTGAIEDRDNITVFDGLTLTKNHMDYDKQPGGYNRRTRAEYARMMNHDDEATVDDDSSESDRSFDDNEVEPSSPLEEVTTALNDKAIKFLATRDYELQLPEFFFEGATIKLSPKEVDDTGALIRVDFKKKELGTEGRFFKKIKKLIKSKLITSFLALLLIIKLIKIKFMFIIPFLFGIGTAKKLFLKLLLFFIPAFAHVFKLCSSYYSSGTKYHHHHHQIAHHHHHVPVPVPVPAYHDHHPHVHDAEEFDGYDYTQPHIQYRKDVEELKEWGIEPYVDDAAPYRVPQPLQPNLGPYGMPQYAPNVRPIAVGPNQLGSFEKYVPQTKHDKPPGIYEAPNPNIRYTPGNIGVPQFNKNFAVKPSVPNLGPIGNHAQSLAYNGYIDDVRFTRATAVVTEPTPPKQSHLLQQYHHQQKPKVPYYGPQIRPGGGYPKAYGFLSKSGTAGPWLSGSPGDENPHQSQFSTQATMKTPVFVQSVPTNAMGSGSVHATGSSSPQNPMKPKSLAPGVQESVFGQATKPSANQGSVPVASVETVRLNIQKVPPLDTASSLARRYDDDFYGPILNRLEDIFMQLRFVEEECRERLVCSMYKNPSIYAPSSNLVSNELSRDSEELKRGNPESNSGRRFHRYLNAARSGQDRGDCLRLYPCPVSTE